MFEKPLTRFIKWFPNWKWFHKKFHETSYKELEGKSHLICFTCAQFVPPAIITKCEDCDKEIINYSINHGRYRHNECCIIKIRGGKNMKREYKIKTTVAEVRWSRIRFEFGKVQGSLWISGKGLAARKLKVKVGDRVLLTLKTLGK